MVVEISDLDAYSHRVYNKNIKSVEDNDKVFEALCEVLAKKHPETEDVNEIAERFEESDKTAKEFQEELFDERIDDELFGVINYAHRNKWVKYSVQRMIEEGII